MNNKLLHIKLSVNANNLHNVIQTLQMNGINVYSATNLDECLDLGYYKQDDLSDLVYSFLEGKDELKNCSEEQLYELSEIIAKKIPQEMYTSEMEDQIHENVCFAILNYLSELDLNNELSIVQKGYTVQPQTKDELAAIIYKTCQEKGWDCDLNFIDTSKITDMSFLFLDDAKGGYGLEHFNGDISKWNTSNVTDMEGMFWGADSFNQNINNWDVSNVTDMEGMFCYTTSFNQPLNNWDISNVTDMEAMFLCAEHFSQDLSQWKINDNCFIDMMFDNTYSLPDSYLPFDLQLDLKTNLINSDHLSSDNNIFIEAPKNDPLLKNTKAIYLQTDRIWIFPINELNSNNTFVLDKNCYKTYDDVLSCSPMLKADICQLFIKNQKNEFTQEFQDKIQDKSEKR